MSTKSNLVTIIIALALSQLFIQPESAPQAFRRDPGHPQWHHGAFHDVGDSVRSDVRRMLHTRAEVPFQVPLEVNVVVIGFNGDGGYRYSLDTHKLEEFLRTSFPNHRPSCLETGEPLDIEHHVVFNAFPAGQPELIALEKALKEAMVPAGKARETDFGREVPLFEVEATVVEPVFRKFYSYIFDMDSSYAARENDRPVPNAIFIVNFDKVRMDPRNKEIDLDSLMYGKIPQLTDEDMSKQEGDYIYRYRYNGGGATQAWLSSDRFVVIDLSAGPCTYGKIETEEGSVSSRTLPRIRNMMFPKGVGALSDHLSPDIFVGQLAALVATTVEHVIAPDVRFETVDLATRLLIPIIVLQNHNRYNIMEKGHYYSINIEEIESEVKKMVHDGQEVVIVGGSHALHRHEKLAIAVSKAMRGHSLQETKKDGRFHVRTKTYLDGAILKEEMERSADMLAAGLVELADPSLSSKFFLRQHWMDEPDGSGDSILKHKPLWASYDSRHGRERKKKEQKKQGDLYRTYGTRVIPVFVLSLVDVDPHLMMEDESLVWTSNDVVIVLQHQHEKIPLSYVSETERRHAFPSLAQRHILAGLASAVGGVSAPYEKASHVHERPIVNWLWAAGCHPFGPFSNTSKLSRLLQDVALRNTIYARVDSALHRIRDTSEAVQAFAAEYLKTPLGEHVKGKKNKTATELWIEKFYRKTTNLPEPFPHELVDRLEKYLDGLEEQLVDLSSLLYDHRLQDAHMNSSEILQSSMFTQQYVDHVLANEREKMRCCEIEYKYPVHSSQTYIYGGILLAGFIVYFVVIFFSNPVR
ncbi:uncharacterized protein LOC8258833 [Ricinus communis]|uniref:DUF7906 domain-containing protein n=1 Tax=Ricinus communis TaxID=3988 RepID=B9RZS4_RICCO|nr:uncharacterized protein LOC8258833 [Ricinus communis]EEF43107.1 conserved hypothetical protein [Ricinus communis]|eukprot:XP_002519243.1 uncharacterized protein LOC8258833 [Ricinus communis]